MTAVRFVVRILTAFVVGLMGMVLAIPGAPASADVPSPTDRYDSPHVAALYNYTNYDRGPPIAQEDIHHQRPDDRGRFAALTHPDDFIGTDYGYGTTLQLVRWARIDQTQGVEPTLAGRHAHAMDRAISSPRQPVLPQRP